MFSAKQILLCDIDYSAWANHCLLEACAALTAEETERDLRLSHSSILATLRHTFDAERVWLDCVSSTADRGSWRLPQGDAPRPSLDVLAQEWRGLWDGYRRWLDGASETALSDELIVQLPDREQRLSRWKILGHMLEHSQFHRGQVVAMIRALDHKPPAINRMDFYVAGEPVTAR